MITVACVYWKGRFRGREAIYSESWVQKLKRMVAVSLPMEHRFVCLSNVEIKGVETIPLENNWPGWWSKIELFRPGLFQDRVLYLDLDLVIVKDLTPFLQFTREFAMMEVPEKARGKKEGKLVYTHFNSSVMVWNASSRIYEDLYLNFNENTVNVFWGDQDYIQYTLGTGVYGFPEGWIKKIRHLDKGMPDDVVKIVLCMFRSKGKNNDAIKKWKWVKEIWN